MSFNGQFQSRPSSAIPSSLAPIQERDDSNGSSNGGVSSPTDVDQTSARSLPTEYGRSFRTGLRPRPRNPAGGWHARNISNIIPIVGSEGSGLQRPSRRPAPLSIQHARSQIFRQPQPAAVVVNVANDANNNPEIPPPMVRGRQAWPWQARAQNSSIFTGEPATSSGIRAHSRPVVSRWPWQERAKKSVIFELLSSKEVVKPLPRPRTYQWDQRKSTLNMSNVNEAILTSANEEASTSAAPTQDKVKTQGKQWPWQVRAQQSVIFGAPDKPNTSHQIKYIWDQRRSRVSMQLDPEAKCPKGSHYNENFPTWQRVQDDRVKPAGKPCYYDDDGEGTGNESRKRRSLPKSHPKKKVREVIPLPAHMKSSIAPLLLTKVKGNTCLEIVPVDFKFN